MAWVPCSVGLAIWGEETGSERDLTWVLPSLPLLQSAAAAPSPVMGSMAPSDAMASGPMAPGFFQVQPGLAPPVSLGGQ